MGGDPHPLTPEFGRYANGRLALSFTSDEAGPFGSITVNLAYRVEDLGEADVFIKDWSENQPLADALLHAGWIKYTGPLIPVGFATAKGATLEGPLLEYRESLPFI